LKWIFSNLNNVEKIIIRLEINGIFKKNPIIYQSIIDANFIHKYLMIDRIVNLIHFDFYIISQCQLLSNDIERIINSFKIDPFFAEHQLTNVTCLFDSIKSYQHLSSSIINIPHYSHHFT
jgi:hypothetical protein